MRELLAIPSWILYRYVLPDYLPDGIFESSRHNGLKLCVWVWIKPRWTYWLDAVVWLGWFVCFHDAAVWAYRHLVS